jgi:hypothetical protein
MTDTARTILGFTVELSSLLIVDFAEEDTASLCPNLLVMEPYDFSQWDKRTLAFCFERYQPDGKPEILTGVMPLQKG